MIRPTHIAALGAALALGVPAGAQTSVEAPEAAEPQYEIKVSLSREDPDLHSGPHAGDGPAEFFLFIDGGPTKGTEFGIALSGGTLDAYVIDTEKSWLPLPLENPYPGTIAQVRVGPDCAESPCYLGRMLVKPDEAGAPIRVEVIPSLRAEQAVVLLCDFATTEGFRAYSAAVNEEAPRPREVRGITLDSEESGTPAGGN